MWRPIPSSLLVSLSPRCRFFQGLERLDSQIAGWSGLGGTSKAELVQPPAMGRDVLAESPGQPSPSHAQSLSCSTQGRRSRAYPWILACFP